MHFLNSLGQKKLVTYPTRNFWYKESGQSGGAPRFKKGEFERRPDSPPFWNTALYVNIDVPRPSQKFAFVVELSYFFLLLLVRSLHHIHQSALSSLHSNCHHLKKEPFGRHPMAPDWPRISKRRWCMPDSLKGLKSFHASPNHPHKSRLTHPLKGVVQKSELFYTSTSRWSGHWSL